MTTTEPTGPAGHEADSGRQVIARAASILRTLEQEPGGQTIARITRACGLPRTTVQRMVGALQAEQFVTVASGVVRLGPALARLASAANLDLSARVRPHMEALAAELEETVDLWVERDGFAELVEAVSSTREVRIVTPPACRLPLITTAPGKAFLALWPQADLAARLPWPATANTPRSLTTLAALKAELDETRRTGIGLDREEHADDVCAVAMVVNLGLPDRYALAVPVPSRRFYGAEDTLCAALRACVARIA